VAVLGWNGPEAERAFARVLERYAAESQSTPYVFSGSSPGCDRFGILRLSC
jgi:hypothetical protein